MNFLAMGTMSYGVLMVGASASAYVQGMIRRGAFITMLLGGLIVCVGAVLYWQQAKAGVWLTSIGLYLISDAAWAIGSHRTTPPRYSHHIIRAAIAITIIALMLL